MITIISSTNRTGANTRQVADIYASLLKDLKEEYQILDLKDLPQDFIFTALFENRGSNPEFNEIQKLVDETNKFVFIIPEYNGSFPGILKAFLDGLKFPGSFKGKAGALVGLSSGTMGGSLAMSHLTDILNYLGLFVLPIKPRINNVHKIITEDKIDDLFIMNLLKEQAAQLSKFHCLSNDQ
jgi:NAD(P)H-dependent FMN reductase